MAITRARSRTVCAMFNKARSAIGRYDCFMQGAFSSFDLRPRVREGLGDQRSGAPSKTERKFFDFVGGGVSLYDTLGCSRD